MWRRVLVHEGIGRSGRSEIEGREHDVVAAGRVAREGDLSPVGADRRLEGAAKHIRHPDERAIGKAHGIEVRDAVAVGAEEDGLAVGRPGGLASFARSCVSCSTAPVAESTSTTSSQPPGSSRDAAIVSALRVEARVAPLDARERGREPLQARAVDPDREQVAAVAELAREDDRPPVGRDVGIEGAHPAGEPAHATARRRRRHSGLRRSRRSGAPAAPRRRAHARPASRRRLEPPLRSAKRWSWLPSGRTSRSSGKRSSVPLV